MRNIYKCGMITSSYYTSVVSILPKRNELFIISGAMSFQISCTAASFVKISLIYSNCTVI